MPSPPPDCGRSSGLRLYSSSRSSVRDRSFWPMKRSIEACSSRGSLVNSCDASVAPELWMTAATSLAPEILVDELVRRLLDLGAAQRAGVVVVEQQHVDAALERPDVGADVRHDRTGLVDEALEALDRNDHLREERRLLQLAVLVDVEVLAGQALHQVAALVGDDGVDLDVLDLGAEGDRGDLLGIGRRGRLRRRRLGRRGDQGGGRQRDGQNGSVAASQGEWQG